MPLRVRDTFFMAGTGGIGNRAGSHLMVCLVANVREDNAIVVPIVTRRENTDLSCVLNVGDHPFLRNESCASYDFIRAISITGIDADIASGEIVLEAPVSAEVLVRLQIGLITSDEVEPWAYEAAYGDKLKVVFRHRGHI